MEMNVPIHVFCCSEEKRKFSWRINNTSWNKMSAHYYFHGLHALCDKFFSFVFFFFSLSLTLLQCHTCWPNMLMSSSIGLPDQAQPPIAICNLLIWLTMNDQQTSPNAGWEVRIGGNDGGDDELLDSYDLQKQIQTIFFSFSPSFLLGLNRSSLISLAALESPEILAFLFICQPISLSPTRLAPWAGLSLSHSAPSLGWKPP